MSQISARLEDKFVFYGGICKVCKMKMKKKMQKLKRNLFARVLEKAGGILFKFGM